MSLAEWSAQLSIAGKKPFPKDLQHAEESFPKARRIFGRSLGLVILFLALKFPTPRDEFIRSWTSRSGDDETRVFFALRDVALLMHQQKCFEETHEIGGPLHAHGWQKLLQDMSVIRKASANARDVPRCRH